MTPELQHFLRCANAGQYEHASGGERRAWLLAQAVIEHVGGLDNKNVKGLMEFIGLCRVSCPTAEKWLRERRTEALEA